VFYKDGTAIADATTMLARRDKDASTGFATLWVIDHPPNHRSAEASRGCTYRLLLHEVAANHGGFDPKTSSIISGLTDRHSGLRFRELEILRAAALPATSATSIAVARDLSYVRQHRLE